MSQIMQEALAEIVLDSEYFQFTKSEKETLSEILTAKEKELNELQSKSMTRNEEIHAKRLTIQIAKLKTNIGRL
jgi:hypothetical protein